MTQVNKSEIKKQYDNSEIKQEISQNKDDY